MKEITAEEFDQKCQEAYDRRMNAAVERILYDEDFTDLVDGLDTETIRGLVGIAFEEAHIFTLVRSEAKLHWFWGGNNIIEDKEVA